MALSKPKDLIFELLQAYFSRLYISPVRTKAFTSCAVAALGNTISQKISGMKFMNTDSLLAFALFGLIFGGPIPHYFNKNIYRLIKHPLAFLLTERLIFMPVFQAFYLYMLPLFEGKTHEESTEQMQKMYPAVVIANLKYISLLQYINYRFVPPMLRIFVVNFIDLVWTVYIANERTKFLSKPSRRGKKSTNTGSSN